MAEHAVSMRQVQFAWPGEAPLLQIDHLQIERHSKVFVYGPSGSGKSTLLALVAGITLPTAGTIEVLGHNLCTMSASARDQLRGEHMGFVFQQFNLISYLSTLDNVLLPTAFSPPRRKRLGTQDEASARARELLARLGLADEVVMRSPTQLSVGQQQRVAVARALLGAPPLIVCDEPTSALDADAKDNFLDLLITECDASAAALCFVSHDRALASHFDVEIDMRTLNPAVA